jgi:hypothetical protein
MQTCITSCFICFKLDTTFHNTSIIPLFFLLRFVHSARRHPTISLSPGDCRQHLWSGIMSPCTLEPMLHHSSIGQIRHGMTPLMEMQKECSGFTIRMCMEYLEMTLTLLKIYKYWWSLILAASVYRKQILTGIGHMCERTTLRDNDAATSFFSIDMESSSDYMTGVHSR